jgi:hypothetical protein
LHQSLTVRGAELAYDLDRQTQHGSCQPLSTAPRVRRRNSIPSFPDSTMHDPAPRLPRFLYAGVVALACIGLSACGGGGGDGDGASGAPGTVVTPGTPGSPGTSVGQVAVPAAGQPVDTSQPDQVIGTGTPASCTGQAVVNAVAQGGKIRFNCGPDPVTITLGATARVFNNRPDVTLDGGGLVTLSGGATRRILYQNTCDPAQVWTTANCDNQETPRLTVQNMRFASGNSTGETTDGGGGGAIFVRGGQFKIVNSVFTSNRCDPTGPDVGGGAVRVLDIYQGRPVYVVQSTFGGAAGLGNTCSNGGALSGIGVSYSIYNSLFTHNTAIGSGANPAQPGTPGGGSGGAIYNDGNQFTLAIHGSTVSDNTAIEGGSAVFYVSNNRTGLMTLSDSVFVRNPASRFGTAGLPGFFVLAAPGQPVVTRTTISH